MPEGDGEEVKTTYSVGLQATGGHASVFLRILKVYYKGGKAVRWELTTQRWDFGPGGGNWAKGDESDSELIDGGELTTTGTGTPPDPLTEPKPDAGAEMVFFDIDAEGYEAARKWVDPQVTITTDNTTKPPKKKARKPTVNPHRYKIDVYNCGNFSLDFLKKAKGPDVFPQVSADGEMALPASIRKWIKRRGCNHVWQPDTIFTGDFDHSFNIVEIWVCTLCGMTKPR